MAIKLERDICCENGINPKAIYDFVTRAEQEDLGINSFMIIKGDKVVCEAYHNPYNNDTPHVLYSMSKSITSTALGFAVSEGLINLEDSICKYFGEYDKYGLNKHVKVKHLVTMTAGKMVPMARNRHERDWIKIFFNSSFVSKPGKKFMYINDDFYLLSAIVSKACGETLVDYLNPRLFEPLGIKKPTWETDKFGYAAGGWGLYMDIESQAKIMICYKNMGMFNGKQIIPKEWVEQATKYQVPTVKKGQVDVTCGYGYGFWRTRMPDCYRAYGLHGQFGYVFNKKDTVIMINSGISRDHKVSDAVYDMCKELWNEPVEEYQSKLEQAVSSWSDMDDIEIKKRNSDLEEQYNCKALKTRSTRFGSMLHPTITTVMNPYLGSIDVFSLSKDADGELSLLWKEETDVNQIKLGFDNKYKESPVELGGIKFTACTKACWTKESELTVLIRFKECCHVRRLIFDFSNPKHITIKNDSFPDMPQLATYYLDFSGMPLNKPLQFLLEKYAAPAVLLIGEPAFKIK